MSILFSELGLSAELLRAVTEQGYTTPTPVQAQSIPLILEGRDVLAAAQTGTGKTAGFTLPTLQRLMASRSTAKRGKVRALFLTPTRELAAQIEECVKAYGKHLPLRSTLVFGGVGINPQIDALRRGVDILVATPGRLLDHVGQKTVDLSEVEVLVLDEADRMLDMGFVRDIRKILALLPKKRQNLLFSATFSDEIRTLANGLLDSPATVEVARRNADSEQVTQTVYPVDKSRKRALLSHLVSTGDWQQVLVFTRTKHGANRLAEQLGKDGIEAAAIHGNKSQGARTKALAGFKGGDLRVLVATDIAARGLDIEQLPRVVNFELPNVPSDYVHRIGRTGRAGSTGEAVSLVSADERSFLSDIERLIKRKIDRSVVAGFEPGTGTAVDEEEDNRPPRPQHGRGNGGRSNGGRDTASRAPRSGAPRGAGSGAGKAQAPRAQAAQGDRREAAPRAPREAAPRAAQPSRGEGRPAQAPRAAAPASRESGRGRPVAALLQRGTSRSDNG